MRYLCLLCTLSAFGVGALATPLAGQAQEGRRERRLVLLVNSHHLFGLGFEHQIADSRWAVHGRAAGGPTNAVAALGLRATLATIGPTELGARALLGPITCAGFVDGPSPICEVPERVTVWGGAVTGHWLIALGESRRWRVGPEVAYWRAVSRPENPTRGMWTVGITAHRRVSYNRRQPGAPWSTVPGGPSSLSARRRARRTPRRRPPGPG